MVQSQSLRLGRFFDILTIEELQQLFLHGGSHDLLDDAIASDRLSRTACLKCFSVIW